MKQVVDYPNYYIDESGSVYSDKKGSIHKLSQNPDSDGYVRIEVKRNKRVLVHRLVAIAFIPNPLNLPCVNHKDSNRSNNFVENLEWCTHKDNVNHAWSNGRNDHRRVEMLEYSKSIGSAICKEYSRKRRKLTQYQIEEIKTKISGGRSQSAVAREYNVSQSTVWKIINGLRYSS